MSNVMVSSLPKDRPVTATQSSEVVLPLKNDRKQKMQEKILNLFQIKMLIFTLLPCKSPCCLTV